MGLKPRKPPESSDWGFDPKNPLRDPQDLYRAALRFAAKALEYTAQGTGDQLQAMQDAQKELRHQAHRYAGARRGDSGI